MSETAFRRIYVDLPTEVAEQFKAACGAQRQSQNAMVKGLIIAFINSTKKVAANAQVKK